MSHARALTPAEERSFKKFAKEGMRFYGLTYREAIDHDCYARGIRSTRRYKFDEDFADVAIHLACPCAIHGDLSSEANAVSLIRLPLTPSRRVSYRRAHDVLRYIDRAKKTMAWRAQHVSADDVWAVRYRAVWPRFAIKAGLDYARASEFRQSNERLTDAALTVGAAR